MSLSTEDDGVSPVEGEEPKKHKKLSVSIEIFI